MSAPPALSPASALRLMLPREHGAWAFLLLPLTTGLVVAPSWAGAALALGALTAFFARGPYQAGPSARPLFLGLGLAGALCFGYGAWWGGPVTWVALALAGVLGLPLMARSLKDMRNLVAEVLGLLACAALLPALLGARGIPAAGAFRGWGLLVLLTLPPLIHLRERLAQTRKGGVAERSLSALVVQGVACGLAAGLWHLGLAPGLLPLWTLALLARALWVVSATPRQLGWTEAVVALGHLAVLARCLSGL